MHVPLGLDTDTLLTTTRTVRRRLDFERPVEREIVDECLRIALQGPSGENSQPWAWIVVDDPATRTAIAEIYRAAVDDVVREFRASVAAGRPDVRRRMGFASPDPDDPSGERIVTSFEHLRRNLERVPVHAVPLIRTRLEGLTHFEAASVWGSVLPSAWSFMLALRSRGLGSAWTTAHLYREREMAELLGIPYDRVTQVGLFPVAHTLGRDFRPGARRDLDRTRAWNRWSADLD